jgi:hypothetical protein
MVLITFAVIHPSAVLFLKQRTVNPARELTALVAFYPKSIVPAGVFCISCNQPTQSDSVLSYLCIDIVYGPRRLAPKGIRLMI